MRRLLTILFIVFLEVMPILKPSEEKRKISNRFEVQRNRKNRWN